MMRRLMFGLASALVLALGPGALAQEAKKPHASADQEFVTKAASSGLSEVRLGTIASQRANQTKIREFAEKMVADHTRANDQLKSLAGRKRLRIPAQMTARDQEDVARLERLQGAEFEQAYARQQLEAHQQAVELFERESRSSLDADLKAFAAETLPILRHHLEMARGLAGGSR